MNNAIAGDDRNGGERGVCCGVNDIMGASGSGCVLNARDAQRGSPFSCFGTALGVFSGQSHSILSLVSDHDPRRCEGDAEGARSAARR